MQITRLNDTLFSQRPFPSLGEEEFLAAPPAVAQDSPSGREIGIRYPMAHEYSRRSPAKRCPIERSDSSSQEFWEKLCSACQTDEPLARAEGSLRIVVLTARSWMGEASAAKRLLEEFGRRGHECCICREDTKQMLKQINPSFVLCLCPYFAPPEGVPSALMLAQPHKSSRVCTPEKILRYRNILYCMPDIAELQQSAAKKGKSLLGMQFFPSVGKTSFDASPKRHLFYGGVCHDSRRGQRYGQLYRLLDETDYFDVYGSGVWKSRTPKSYRGFVAWDGGALLNTIRSAGVSLVLHGDNHLAGGTTTSRFFEAAAASNVIISDKHPFIIKHFGDSVLYVDQEATPEEMFRQIDDHMKWIRTNPEKAIELARESHRIFVENFSLENEVGRLEDFIRDRMVEGVNSA
ncbi:MAG: hypothetical protein LBH53_01735 [Puniceicoccales bacterium]|nr:hypothetical protein [Puniceicoccales bacterium]